MNIHPHIMKRIIGGQKREQQKSAVEALGMTMHTELELVGVGMIHQMHK